MSGLSFKFEKTSKKKVLTDSKLRDTSTKDDNAEKDYILDVRDKAIKGSLKPKEEKGPLVIPMIKTLSFLTNKWQSCMQGKVMTKLTPEAWQ